MVIRHNGISKGFKRCPKCDRVLLENQFYRDKSRYDGIQKLCIDCIKMRNIDRRPYFREHSKLRIGTKKYRARVRMRHSPHLYPLTEFCELCPEDDLNKATQHHHPDYDYPTIYVSTCSQCHAYL